MSLLVAVSRLPLGLGWRWEQINVRETTSLGSACSCSEVALERLPALIPGAFGVCCKGDGPELIAAAPNPSWGGCDGAGCSPTASGPARAELT